jgi:alpha-tubulin suppressor-like RCC1 family protein
LRWLSPLAWTLLLLLLTLPVQSQQSNLMAWGYDQYGQLGDGYAPYLPHPTLGISGVKAIAVGSYFFTSTSHTAALKQDGTVWVCGSNLHGELGDGTFTDRSIPVQVLGPGGSGFLTDVKAIAGGGEHTVALKQDGTVWTWGWNFAGQLGDGTTTDRNTPVQVLGLGGVGFLTDVKAIAAGYAHSVALKQDGTVWTWGANPVGELGDGTIAPFGNSSPVQVVGPGGIGLLTGVKAVAAGFHSTVALMLDGTVWTWGENGSGELGDGTTTDPPYGKSTPVQVLGVGGIGFLTDVKAIAAAFGYAVALKQDGTVWVWGSNGNGQLGDGLTNAPPVAQLASGETDVTAIAAGWGHTVALKQDGTVWTWGGNYTGQLGDGTTAIQSTPVQVSGSGGSGFLTGIKAIAAGVGHSVALKQDGTVWTWGSNSSGQLGDGMTIDPSQPPYGQTTPVQVLGPGGSGFLTGVAAIAGGGYYTVALKQEGTVWAWGDNSSGQLGDGTTTSHSTPVQVLGAGGIGLLTGVKAIAAAFGYTVALKQDGTVWAWGYNGDGELGDGTETGYSTPVQVVGPGGIGFLTGVTAIAVGLDHTVALKQDGTVWTWGLNEYGQLGDGTTNSQSTPVQVLGPDGSGFLTGVTAIAAGGEHTVALKQDGTVWTWGENYAGELGDGTVTSTDPYGKSTPVQVLGLNGSGFLTGVSAIAAGGYHTLTLLSAPVTPPAATLTGKVLLQDCLNSQQTINFTFQPNDGSASFNRSLTLNADGSFSLDNIPRRSYDLAVQGSKWLRRSLPLFAGRGDVSGLEAALWAGDVNGDNQVDIFDLGLLADAYNTTPASPKWNAQADLNCDNKVNLLDLGILADSFGKQGDL